MSKPWYQNLIASYFPWVFIGFLFIGSFIDAVNNTLGFITPTITWIGTVFVLLISFLGSRLIKLKPVPWITDDGQRVYVKSLGRKPILVMIGILVALWIPRMLSPQNKWLELTLKEKSLFIEALKSEPNPSEQIILSCASSTEEICTFAGEFAELFKRGNWSLKNDNVIRGQLGIPLRGVTILTYGHADKYDRQDPDQGKWISMSSQLQSLIKAFEKIGIRPGLRADETRPETEIVVYFGIEP
jgi:hypothetical protein